MIDGLRRHLTDRWGELRPGSPPPRDAIILGANKAPALKVVLLFFDALGEPAVVVKVARTEQGERALEAEARVLGDLWATSAPAMTGCAPRPLAFERVDERQVLVLSALDGDPMLTRYHAPGHTADPRLVERDFQMAGRWLTSFERDTSGPLADAGTQAGALAERVLEGYRREIGWSDVEQRLFAEVRDRARDLEGVPIRTSGVHGDFWMGNLLVDGDAVRGVVDWEFGDTCGLPFRDAYKFPTSYGFYLDRLCPGGRVPGHPGRDTFARSWGRFGAWPNLAGFGYTFFGRGWFPALVRRHVLELLASAGVPRESNAVFFPLFLAQQATALDVAEFRAGYRSLLHAFWEERASTWLWSARAVTSPI